MFKERVFWIGVILIIVITAIIAITKQFSWVIASLIGGISVGAAIVYCAMIRATLRKKWRKPALRIVVSSLILLLFLSFLAVMIINQLYWVMVAFIAGIAVGALVAYVVMATMSMRHKK